MEIVNVDNLLERGYLDSVMQNGGKDSVAGHKAGTIYIGYDSYLQGEFFYIIDTIDSMLIIYQGKRSEFRYELFKDDKGVFKNNEPINSVNGKVVIKRVLKEFAEKNRKTITINIKGV